MIELFRKITEFIRTYPFFVLRLALDAVLIVSAVLLIRRRKRLRRRQELMIREQKSRQLTQRLSNPEYLEREDMEYGRSYPYQVRSEGIPPFAGEGEEDVEVGLAVQTQMLTRDYLLPVSDGIMIGRGANNTVCIDDPDLAEHHCRIFRLDDMLCLEAVAGQPAYIERSGSYHQLGEAPVELASGDIIYAGASRIILNFHLR
ncbi:MAG: FHA domain-containing protein [Lachnospiraceae bacterium]|nr:FHA domain-containing protein [Lachnospiraceae bacterium]